jgi:putative N6-adenine-specific DNA methylase
MKFFVTCAKGTEGALRRELNDLRIRAPRGDRGGVSFEGSFADAAKVCLGSRVGMRVLMELGAFPVPTGEALYEGARRIAWADHLDARSTLAVSAHVRDSEALRHSGFAALKVKDAVVDTLRDRLGARPDVDTRDPDVAIVLHVEGRDARLYLDLAGEPLHRRGYRVAMTDAPMKESLAAAILALGDAAPDRPLVDPMAGSGTFVIEQAQRARRMAPGLNRRFGFERWPGRPGAADLARLRAEAKDAVLPRAPAPLLARDRDPRALEAARRNAAAAGVVADIRFETGDVRTLRLTGAPGTLIVNPPYGERLGPAEGTLSALYADMARAFTAAAGWRLVMFTATPEPMHAMRRKPQISHKLWNGPLEARMLCWSL